MKKSIILFVLPFVVFSACNKNEVVSEIQEASFTAVAVNNETKTSLGTDGTSYTMLWTGNETAEVRELKKEFVTPGSGSHYEDAATTRYRNFKNTISGSSATFASTTFPDSFEAGYLYIVRQPLPSSARTEYYRANTSESDVDRYVIYDYVPDSQTYNPGNTMGLSDNIIPLFGLIERGRGGEYEPTAVKMHTAAAIVKLVVTNEGASRTIDHITMESEYTGKGKGIAGSCLTNLTPNPSPAPYTRDTWALASTTCYSLITLDCGDETIDKNQTKTFSFVVAGVARGEMGTLTWKIYEDGNVTPIKIVDNTASTRLEPEHVYKKAVTL